MLQKVMYLSEAKHLFDFYDIPYHISYFDESQMKTVSRATSDLILMSFIKIKC